MAATTPLTTKVPAATAEAIADRASQMGISKSQLMSDAIAQYLSPAAGTPPPAAPEPTAIDPDTRLTLPQMAQALGVEYRIGSMGFWLAGDRHLTEGSAIAAAEKLSGWVWVPGIGGGGFAPPRPPEVVASWVPSPDFAEVGQVVSEQQVIHQYRLETPDKAGFTPLDHARLKAQYGPPPGMSRLVAGLTGGDFEPAGCIADCVGSIVRAYKRVR
jgi:hypothetical protein